MRRPLLNFSAIHIVMAFAFAAVSFTPQASANGENLYLECPCSLVSDGSTVTATFGVRSFRATDSGELQISIEAAETDKRRGDITIGEAFVIKSVRAGARLTGITVRMPLDHIPMSPHYPWLVLREQRVGAPSRQDSVRMNASVDVTQPFEIGDLDYLKDADGDGVGDVNERTEGADPNDPRSTPGASTVDVLALYSRGWAETFGGDPLSRISHLFAAANVMLEDSAVSFRLRVVGAVEVDVVNENERYSSVERGVLLSEGDRHGADVPVVFAIQPPNATGGHACPGHYGSRGHIDIEAAKVCVAVVRGWRGARTLMHELGHIFGLAHSFSQRESGAWRWSRGHDVPDDFSTIMSYGRGGQRLHVFSDPNASCRGDHGAAKPCGEHKHAVAGADAVTSLNAVRFQFAKIRQGFKDTDGDGFVDPVDDLPRDGSDWLDTDQDGVGNLNDLDDDGDGVPDALDAFPVDAQETTDTDGDGVGDHADTDDDGDGVEDRLDAFPLDAEETMDSDGDGVGDNADAFPQDPLETADTDRDGAGDNADTDDDGDGVADAFDVFPLDVRETADSDSDGVGDSADAFPQDPSETTDTDGDGVGDNTDRFPNNPNDWSDADGDGVGDNTDGDIDGDGLVNVVDPRPAIAGRRLVASYAFVAESAADIRILYADGEKDGRVVIGDPSDDSNRGAVYVIAAADFDAVDALDGRVDREIHLANVAQGAASWKLLGEQTDNYQAKWSADSAGDMDGDGLLDLLVGASGFADVVGNQAVGAVYFVSGASLEAADAADGMVDGNVSLDKVATQPRSWKVVGNTAHGHLGFSVATGNLYGNDRAELVLGAPFRGRSGGPAGNAYVIALEDLPAADAADGVTDGAIQVDQAVAQPASYRLKGAANADRTGENVGIIGDLDGDGYADIGIGALAATVNDQQHAGAVYLISTGALASADAADGQTDGIIELKDVSGRSGFWKVTGNEPEARLGRYVIAQGRAGELVLGATNASYLIALGDLPALDAADDAADGVISVESIASAAYSWKLGFLWNVRPLVKDRDATSVDSMIGERWGSAILFEPNRLGELQRNWRVTERNISSSVIENLYETLRMSWTARGYTAQAYPAGDIDGDGLVDLLLAEPVTAQSKLPSRTYLLFGSDLVALDLADGEYDRNLYLYNVAGDTDIDGISNTADSDDDNDGHADAEDRFPLDPDEWVDTDGDQWGNNVDQDDDNDGIPDGEDAFPESAAESADTDGDGIGNNADTDDDGDGMPDVADAFPLDATESNDSDGDGVGDNADAFADDPNEWADADADGIGDNADPDDDNDGTPDREEAVPLDTANRMSLKSLRFVAETRMDQLGRAGAGLGDLDRDGRPELLLSAPGLEPNGAAFLISSRDLQNLDEADGSRDGVILVGHVASQPNSWKLIGEDGFNLGYAIASAGDLNGDSVPEFVLGAPYGEFGAAYVLSALDLAAGDASDGDVDGIVSISAVVKQAASWRVKGNSRAGLGGSFYGRVATGYAQGHILLGQPRTRGGAWPGTAHLLDRERLSILDEADGDLDRQINFWNIKSIDGHRMFTGENPQDRAGSGLAILDFDGDGRTDVVIGAPRHDANALDEGAVYVVSGKDFASDSEFELARTADGTSSFKIIGEGVDENLGTGIAVGDMSGDGVPDLVLNTASGSSSRAIVNVVSLAGASLESLDSADGERDGVIELKSGGDTGHWRITHRDGLRGGIWLRESIALMDSDGDRRSDALVPLHAKGGPDRASFLLLPAVDSVPEGSAGGIVATTEILEGSGYAFHVDVDDWMYLSVGSAGDVDGDGREDFMLGTTKHSDNENDNYLDSVYLIVSADLKWLDAADGSEDGVIQLSNVAGLRQ